MAFSADLAAHQSALYAYAGVSAVFTPSGGAGQGVTVLLDKEGAGSDTGGGFDMRPAATPAHTVRLRTSELTAKGLMEADPVSREQVPVWRDATIALEGGAPRKIAGKARPADPRRAEWIFDLT